MDIGRKIQSIDARLAKVERSARLSHAAIDNTAVVVRDGDGGLRGIIGLQTDGTTAVNVVNGAAPPQPTAPAVTSALGGVIAAWDGTFADGSPLPLDWQRVEVHASTTSGFTPDATTLKDTIETPQGAEAVVLTDAPVYVRLMARNTSGTASTPSDQVGPFGPIPVVADDLEDGIVTTLKLADDAVTNAKVAVNAIDATSIQDGSISTPKLAALAVQAGNIAADAVEAGKIAADAVTAREIAALAVTAAEIAANTITAGKLAAGSVDATALSATAITGKTITGGTITGTTITGALIQTAASGERITLDEAGANKVLVYNSAGTAIGELSSQGLLVKGTSGAVLWLNPNATYPQLLLYNAATTKKATVQVTEPTAGDANLEQFCAPFTSGSYTDVVWRSYLARDYAVMERLRATATSTIIGGRLYLDPGYVSIGFKNTDNTAQEATFIVEPNLAHLDGGRLQVTPPASASSVIYGNAATGHTGNLLRAAVNGTDKFTVDASGNLTVAGIGQRTTKRRTTDATKTSTTTPGTDGFLTWAVDANATYILDGFLKYSGPGDFLMGWTFPTGTLGEWHGIGNGTTVASEGASNAFQNDVVTSFGYTVRTETTDIASTRTYGGIGSTTFGVQVRGIIRVSSTAGTFALQWAQGTSNATGTVLYTDSHLRLEKVA